MSETTINDNQTARAYPAWPGILSIVAVSLAAAVIFFLAGFAAGRCTGRGHMPPPQMAMMGGNGGGHQFNGPQGGHQGGPGPMMGGERGPQMGMRGERPEFPGLPGRGPEKRGEGAGAPADQAAASATTTPAKK